MCVIAGMPRASTTFLYHTLAKHPSCFVPSRKELEFFSLNGERGKSWYLNYFKSMPGTQIGFDISPLYFFAPDAARKIREFYSRPKVILIVRDPAEFVLSFYKNRLAADGESLGFHDFVNGYQYQKDGANISFSMHPGVICDSIGRFREQLADDLLLVDFRLMQRDPLNALHAIESFCGIPAYFDESNFDNVKVNASDQLNIRAVNMLMHQKWFADLVTFLVPKKLIMMIRYRLQTSKRDGAPILRAEIESQHLAEMRETLARDSSFVEELFCESPLVLGDGSSFCP